MAAMFLQYQQFYHHKNIARLPHIWKEDFVVFLNANGLSILIKRPRHQNVLDPLPNNQKWFAPLIFWVALFNFSVKCCPWKILSPKIRLTGPRLIKSSPIRKALLQCHQVRVVRHIPTLYRTRSHLLIIVYIEEDPGVWK